MSAMPEADTARAADPAKCLARSVVEAMARNPALEAVTINRARHTISVATLGKTDVPKLTERIGETVLRAQQAMEQAPCLLLAGEGDCHTCVQPLSEQERQKITIRHDDETTTIARVTCP